MRYLKSLDFPIHLMTYWWLLWIVIAYTPINEFLTPSLASLGQFLILIASFVFGHLAIKRSQWHVVEASNVGVRGLRIGTIRVRWTLMFTGVTCLLMLLVSLKLAGAFDTAFLEYYARMRGGSDAPQATGIHALDVLTKILAFPLAYTILVIAMAVDLTDLRKAFFISTVSFACFCYLWQVNYPLIHLFWFLVFHVLVTAQRRGRFNRTILGVAAIVVISLLASATNRYGDNDDVFGAIRRYFIGYHLIGFSFYDHHFMDANSILHVPSFGRSSLGFFEHVMQQLLEPFSTGFRAASSANAEFNDVRIDIGASDPKAFNAFGTIVFTLYRDFNLVGIALGGFLYGAAATYTRYRGSTSWRHGAIFYLLASAWMMGMFVSPVEAAYFWFVVVALGLFQIVNRGVRWRTSQRVDPQWK